MTHDPESKPECKHCNGTGTDGHDRQLPPNDYICEHCNGTGKPEPDLREQFEREKQEAADKLRRSFERQSNASEDPQTTQDQPIPVPTKKSLWDSEVFQMIFGAVFWIVVIWLAVTYFG